MGYNIVENTNKSRKGIILLLLAIIVFVVSIIIPNYVFRKNFSYFDINNNVDNTSICCVNDAYTCNLLVEYINNSIRELGEFKEINVIIYDNFNSYVRSNNTCNIVLGLNEFQYIIAKNRKKINHIDYLTTYMFLGMVPHNDFLFKSFIVAIPYCYTIEELDEISYGTLLEKVLDKNMDRVNKVKIYRLIVIDKMNNILDKVISYIIKNNTETYGWSTPCISIYHDINVSTVNNVLSYYDIRRVLAMMRGVSNE